MMMTGGIANTVLLDYNLYWSPDWTAAQKDLVIGFASYFLSGLKLPCPETHGLYADHRCSMTRTMRRCLTGVYGCNQLPGHRRWC